MDFVIAAVVVVFKATHWEVSRVLFFNLVKLDLGMNGQDMFRQMVLASELCLTYRAFE